MPDKPRAEWSQVWKLYVDHGRVFRSAFQDLSRRGIVFGADMERNLVHEFLAERAPKALATFRPERGQMGGWLYVVFRRFVLGTLRTAARERRTLEALAVDPSLPRVQPDLTNQDRDTRMLGAIDAAVDALPSLEQRALVTYFGTREHGERAVARALDISRWKASRLVARALRTVAIAIGVATDSDPLLDTPTITELIWLLRRSQKETTRE